MSETEYKTPAQRWRALTARDARASGHFVYSVATTGIYCRPACPSRLASRANIVFHKTAADAERAGFRPCKRCAPNAASPREQQKEAVIAACRLIETAESTPKLADLASSAGFSPFHFQRLFKSMIGLSPREYAAQRRSQLIRSELKQRPSVTAAIYSAGYSSSSRFYERASSDLGMSPSAFRRSGEHQQIRYAIEKCSLGLALIAGTPRGICAIFLGDDPRVLESELQVEFTKAQIQPADAPFQKWVKAVLGQIDEPARHIDLPLDIRGTAFQQRVWEALRRIPVGQTTTYTELASRIGAPSAVRAVARACATNPVSIVVPCHRVVRKDKSLAGYRWGLQRKQALLDREKRVRHRGKS